MTWTDPIVADVRAIRDEHARKFGYDLKRIFEDIQDREATSGRTYLRLPPRLIAPDRNRPPVPSEERATTDSGGDGS